MTNLERARQGERLKVKSREYGQYVELVSVTDNDSINLLKIPTKDLCEWINEQIDLAVTHAIDDTKEHDLWRDLEEGEVYQDGDRILLSTGKWIIIQKDNFLIGTKRERGESLAQRRVRKEDL